MQWLKLLKNRELVQCGLLIDGQWLDKDRETFPVTNPATGEVLANITKATPDDLAHSVESCSRALVQWKKLTAKERSKLLRRWYDLLIANADDLAIILTLEQGKPLAEAKGEILYGAAYLEWYSEEARRLDGTLIDSNNPNQRILVKSEPVGVCAAITPWNFPNAMLARKVAPALAAGIPAGVFNVIHGHSGTIGEFLCHHQSIRKLSFTGSTEVGIWLYQNCANSMKKLSLELGGNAPLIVFEDADVDVAVTGIMLSKFRNSGQTCVCSNRIFVHRSIKDQLLLRLQKEINNLTVGNGLEAGISNGPLIDRNALIHVSSLVADALNNSAQLLCGGKALTETGELFYAPTLLDCPHDDLRVFKEEIFGPILAVYTFDSEEEVIELANKTPYGLASYMFSRDIGRIFRVAEALEYGMVGVNSGLISAENVPFGGVKMSGLGREGSHAGINEYLNQKYICLNL